MVAAVMPFECSSAMTSEARACGNAIKSPPEVCGSSATSRRPSGDRSIDGDLVFQIVTIPFAPASQTAVFRQTPGAWEERQLRGLQHNRDAAPRRHFLRVSQQPESGHVRARVSRNTPHHCGCRAVEGNHGCNGGSNAFLRRFSPLECRRDDACSQRFRENERVSGLDTDVANDAIRMHHAGDRHAVLQLFVDDGVPTDHHGARFPDPLGAAADDVAQNLEVQFALREPDNVQGRLRLAAHRIDIAQGVGRRDLAEHVRVVDDGRKEVHRIDDGEIRPETEYSRIVGRFRADNQVGRLERWEAVQHLQQVGRAELRRSTGGGNPLCESHLFEFLPARDFHHDESSVTAPPDAQLIRRSSDAWHRRS